MKEFAEYFHKCPDLLGAEEVRQYQLYLLNYKKLAAQTVKVRMTALPFFYWKTLKRRDLYFDDLPLAKTPKRLPTVRSPEKVVRLTQAASSLMHRTIPILLYATRIRRAELRRSQVTGIESHQMVIHIQQSKNWRDRDIPMTPLVLKVSREYWQHARPKVCLFPRPFLGNEPEKPIPSKTVWNVVHEAAVAAGFTKQINSHTLRHSFVTHHRERGTDLPVLQSLLDHA